jgi:deoxycytidine triphosphate deaminase
MLSSFHNRLLTDRGIKDAEAQNMLRIDPKVNSKQRQPASIDLKFKRIDDAEAVNGAFKSYDSYRYNSALFPGYETTVNTQSSIMFDNILKPFVELRSSMRRLGCYLPIPAMQAGDGWGPLGFGNYNIALDIVNHSTIPIKLHRGDRIAQLMVFFNSFSREDLDNKNILLNPNLSKDDYKMHLDLDHGYDVLSQGEIRALSSKGYFKVEPELSMRKGLIKVRAGKTARIITRSEPVVFSKRPKFSELCTEVELPYRLKPGEFIDVDAAESMDLSRNIGITFHSEYLFTNFLASKKKIEIGAADYKLALKWDGWIDPGYKGPFSRQPKTYFKAGKLIKPGDVLGYGRIYYFPAGVERMYGHSGLYSQYQGGTDLPEVK